MAVRTSASSQNYSTTLSLGSQTQATITCWAKFTSIRAGVNTIWRLGSSSSDYLRLAADSVANDLLVVADQGGNKIMGPLPTVDVWYFLGVRWDGTVGTLVYRAMSATTWSSASQLTSLASSHTATSLYLSNSQAGGGGGDYLNGCICAVKGWVGTALTAEQIQQETWSITPKNAGCTFWYPLLTTETADYSGQGYTLTGGVGATVEAGPAVGWGPRRQQRPITDTIEVVIGQATSTEVAQPVEALHEVGRAISIEAARATAYEVEVNTATEINIPIEILDPIAIGVTPLTASSAAASAQSWATASVTPTSQRLILLCVAWAASTAVAASPIASVTGNGLTWVLVLGQNYGAATGTINARHRMEVWRAMGTSPTAGAITVTHAASQPGIGRCWSVFEVFSTDLSGTNGSGAIRQTASNRNIAASALTATLGAFGSTSNATIGVGAGGNVMTIGTGFTSITAQRSTSVPDVSLITEWLLGADTTVDVNQTAPTDQMGVIGIEIKRRIVEPLLPGPVTEVDTAQAIAGRKTKTAGQVSSAHTAQAVTAQRVKVLGMASSTNAAQMIVRPVLTGTVNQTSLTNTAQAVLARKTLLVGQATSSQTGQVVSRLKQRAVGQANGTHTARAISALKVKLVAQALSTATAQAISRLKTAAVGQAAATSTAQAVARLKTLAVNRVSGVEQARTLTTARARPLTGAVETQTARVVTGARVYAVLRTATSEQARAFTALRVRAIGQATELGTVQSIVAQKLLLVGQASSTDLAQAVSSLKVQALGRAAEMASALAIVGLRVLQLAQAVETTLAGLIRRAVGLAQALASEAARAVGQIRGVIQVVEPQSATDVIRKPTQAAAVGRATEAGAAVPVVFLFTEVVIVGQVTVTNLAHPASALRLVSLARTGEDNVAQTIGRLFVDRAAETSTALTVIFSMPGTVVVTSSITGSAQLGVELAGAMLSSGPIGMVQTSAEQAGARLTVERQGGVGLTEGV